MLLRLLTYLAACQDCAEVTRRLNLAIVGTNGVYVVLEWLHTAIEGVERHSSDMVSEAAEALCVNQRVNAVGRHKLRAVKQRKALLRAERDRLPAHLLHHHATLDNLAINLHVAEAQQWQAHMRQRREVARSTERALLIYHRDDVVVEHLDKTLYGDELHARVAVR